MNPWRRGGGVGRTGAPPLAAGARPAAAQAGRPAGATRGRVVGTAYVKRAGYTHRLPPSRIIHGGAWYGCWGTHAARQRPGAALVAEWVSARVDRRTPEAALLTITVNPATVLDRPVAASGRLTPPRGDRGVGGSGAVPRRAGRRRAAVREARATGRDRRLRRRARPPGAPGRGSWGRARPPVWVAPDATSATRPTAIHCDPEPTRVDRAWVSCDVRRGGPPPGAAAPGRTSDG